MPEDFEQYAPGIDSGLKSDANEFLLNAIKPLDEFDEREASWLIPGWIPSGQITLLAADGGIGKTSLWVHILAAISRGNPCIMDPPGYNRPLALSIFLSGEDSVRRKLKKKLRLAGADPSQILTPDFVEHPELLHDLKLGSQQLDSMIRWYRPALCVIDPLQSFLPPKTNMSARNEMRDLLAPLVSLGEETGTAFLIVCHTNKRSSTSGRGRVSDSSDLWDVARSVLMAGHTADDAIRYLSQEKNNYDQLQETLLFSISDDGQVQAEGRSWKRDREYQQENSTAVSAPKRNDCKEWLLNLLEENNGCLPVKELESQAQNAGYSSRTLRRAKDDLKDDGAVRYQQTGWGQRRVWTVCKVVS